MIIKLTFPALNTSLQIGDRVYVVPQIIENGGFDFGNAGNSYYIGFVSSIVDDVDSNGLLSGQALADDDTVVATEPFVFFNVYVDAGAFSGNIPTENDFIFFVKDERVNLSSLVGSYGEAKFVNDSRDPAEMFAASCEISQSSK